MKKAVVINASPRRNGTTDTLTRVFLEDFNGDVKTFNIYDYNIAACLGCSVCGSGNGCFMHDIDEIVNAVFSCDYLIFASPVYCYSFPAPMKAFLDRLQPFYSDEKYKNPAFVRKGFLLATCGKSGKFSIDVMEKQCRIGFLELDTEFCGSFFQTDTDKFEILSKTNECKVKLLAKSFFCL